MNKKQKFFSIIGLIFITITLFLPLSTAFASGDRDAALRFITSNNYTFTYTPSTDSKNPQGQIIGNPTVKSLPVLTFTNRNINYNGAIYSNCKGSLGFDTDKICFVSPGYNNTTNKAEEGTWYVWIFDRNNPSSQQFRLISYDSRNWGSKFDEGSVFDETFGAPSLNNSEALFAAIKNDKGINLVNKTFTLYGELIFDAVVKNPDMITGSTAIFANQQKTYEGKILAGKDSSSFFFEIPVKDLTGIYLSTPLTVYIKSANANTACVGQDAGTAGSNGTGSDVTGINKCTIFYSAKLSFTLDQEGRIIPKETDAISQKNAGKRIDATNASDRVRVAGSAVSWSPLDQALNSAIKTLAGVVESGLNFVMNGINDLLLSTQKYVLSSGVEGAWTKMRNIGLTLLVLGLLIIAFANVLQIDIQAYGLNRMIPKLIIAIIFTYVSWTIVTFFFDFTAALQGQALGLLGGNGKMGLEVLGAKIDMPTTGDILGKAGSIILLIAIFFGVLVCGAILWFSLLLRVVMLAFLLAVAPIAFILSIMPFTETLYKRWWAEFWKWMFMGPVAMIIIALGYTIATGFGNFGQANTTISYSAVEGSTAGTGTLIGLIIFGASLYLAATLPISWGGSIMKSWNKIGKNWWGKTGGAALGSIRKSTWDRTGGKIGRQYGAIISKRSDLRHAREEQAGAANRAKLATMGAPGRWAVGATKEEAATLAEAAITGAQKKASEQAKLDPAAITQKRRELHAAGKDNTFEARGIDRALLENGKMNNVFVDPNATFTVPSTGAAMSIYDKTTGGLVDTKNYSAAADFGGNVADFNAFKAHVKAQGNAASIDTARYLASQGKADKVTRDLAVDKLAKGAALSVKAPGASIQDEELYRDVVSKQKGKAAREWNHDFVENAKEDFITGMSAQEVEDAIKRGNPKLRGAMEGRLRDMKASFYGAGAAGVAPTTVTATQLAELERGYQNATGRSI